MGKGREGRDRRAYLAWSEAGRAGYRTGFHGRAGEFRQATSSPSGNMRAFAVSTIAIPPVKVEKAGVSNSESEGQGRQNGRLAILIARTASSLAMWGIALGIILSGAPLAFFGLITVLSLLGLWEFYRMLQTSGLHVFSVTGLVSGLFFLSGSFYFLYRGEPSLAQDFEICVLLLFVFVVFGRQFFTRLRGEEPLQSMAYTLFGLLYVVWLFSFVTKLVFLAPRIDDAVSGHWLVLWLVIVTKFCDMGAYLVGMLFGKHPLVPTISPKKTWEGLVGSLLFAQLGGLLGFYFLGAPLAFLNWSHVVLLGLLIGCAAVIGDLAESMIKRSVGAKDSGKLLPGIGGVLDLIDSLLFTAPILYFYLRFVVGLP